MPGGYEFAVYSSRSFVNTNDRMWGWAQDTVAHLKSFSGAPWVTRGSSISGPSLYSATPDGVDRWAGAATADAAGVCWHVLENTISGIQICIEASAAGGTSILRLTVAKNKFETGGAWRGGGGGVGSRPTDVTSSPAADREVTMTSGLPSTANNSYRFNWVNKLDGKGFYGFYWDDVDNTPAYALAIGFFKLVNPHPSDSNPYCVFNIVAVGFSDGTFENNPSTMTPTNFAIFYCRSQDGSAVVKHSGFDLITARTQILGTSDQFESKPGAWPLPLHADLPVRNYRGCAHDILLAWTSSPNTIQTYGSKSYIRLGSLLLPWNGVTTKGTDQPFFLVNIGPEAAPDAPVVSNLAPTAGTVIQSTDTLAFDVTCASGAVGLVVVSVQASGESDQHVAWDGLAFTPAFSGGSAKTDITNGHHFVLKRDGGWPGGGVRVTVKAAGSTGGVLQ